MFQLDDNFLASLGLSAMPADERADFLDFIYQELEMRVGTELSKDLSDEQLEHFEKLLDSGSQDAALQWLERHCPTYKEVVKQELDKIKADILLARDQLLGAAGSNRSNQERA